MLKFWRSILSVSVLFSCGVLPPAAHAGRLQKICEPFFVKLGFVVKPEPELFLTDADRVKIENIANDHRLTPADRFERLWSVWINARTRHMNVLDQSLVINSSPQMSDQNVVGIRADGSLEEAVKLDGMEYSMVRLFDLAHDLESDIMTLDALGQISKQRSVERSEMDAVYREAALEAEWEISHALPADFVRAEIERMRNLRLPEGARRFAIGLLEAGRRDRAGYLKIQNRKFLGHGRILDWRATDNPHRAARAKAP